MIEVRRRFAATPERVFDAWTQPEVLTEWWSAGPSHRPGLAEVDLRVGGRYRLSMIDDDGVETVVGGEYVEVRRPDRLAFTWRWLEGGEDPTAGTTSLVEIDSETDGDNLKSISEFAPMLTSTVRFTVEKPLSSAVTS